MLPEPFLRAVDEIRRDNLSGATYLVRRGARALCLVDGAGADLEHAARSLVSAQPTMAPMWNLANEVLWAMERREATIEQAAVAFTEKLSNDSAAVVRHAANLICEAGVVLTHSYSATVRDSLLLAANTGSRFQVIVTEARPMCEGSRLAEELAHAGIEVTLIVDSAMLGGISRAELALSGVDSVSDAGLTNKTGTALLAVAARATGVPIYATCGSQKFLPMGCPEPAEPPKPAEEISRVAAPGLRVENYYFDRTPLDQFNGIVTEDGVVTPAEVRERLGHSRLHPALAGVGHGG